MSNMKEKMFSKIVEKVTVKIGEESIKLSEKSVDYCLFFFSYEPKISIELLKANKKE